MSASSTESLGVSPLLVPFFTAPSVIDHILQMGITDNAHPTLPAKIKEQMPEGNVSEEAENNIVSNLVEELLFMSPKPTASGSGLRDGELPGAWA